LVGERELIEGAGLFTTPPQDGSKSAAASRIQIETDDFPLKNPTP